MAPMYDRAGQRGAVTPPDNPSYGSTLPGPESSPGPGSQPTYTGDITTNTGPFASSGVEDFVNRMGGRTALPTWAAYDPSSDYGNWWESIKKPTGKKGEAYVYGGNYYKHPSYTGGLQWNKPGHKGTYITYPGDPDDPRTNATPGGGGRGQPGIRHHPGESEL